MSIDKQRVRAVQKLEELGWKFIDNNWAEPQKKGLGEVTKELDSKYKDAVKIVETNGGIYNEVNKCWQLRASTVNQQLNDAYEALKDLRYALIGTNYYKYILQVLSKYKINI